MIRNKLRYVVIAAAFLMVLSCNSVESDAKKAASLVNKSIEQSRALKFEDAEKTYLKAQEIFNKYTKKDKAAKFFEYYAEYRDKVKKQNAN